MKRKNLFLIRHGQTALNAKGKVLGLSDIELTDEGIDEVKRLTLHLKEQRVYPQKIYVSPLKRAIQTAEMLQTHLGGTIGKVKALREINYGVYEGSGRAGLKDIAYGYNSQKMKNGQGETVEEVEQRVTAFLDVALETDESCVLIVSHAFIISVITQLLMREPRIFATIQPLATADYNYFQSEGNKKLLNVLTVQKNYLKGSLHI